MTFELLSVVSSLVDLPAKGVKNGMPGTIVEVYGDGQYEVEFVDADGYTFALVTLSGDYLHARSKLKKAA